MREVLAEAMPELKDPRIGIVTVTGVKTTRDLRQATVYVSVLGSEKKRAARDDGARSRRTASSRPGSRASST